MTTKSLWIIRSDASIQVALLPRGKGEKKSLFRPSICPSSSSSSSSPCPDGLSPLGCSNQRRRETLDSTTLSTRKREKSKVVNMSLGTARPFPSTWKGWRRHRLCKSQKEMIYSRSSSYTKCGALFFSHHSTYYARPSAVHSVRSGPSGIFYAFCSAEEGKYNEHH